jgi:NADP-dependent 3-hydroxy acid dehydrogenase YdfG
MGGLLNIKGSSPLDDGMIQSVIVTDAAALERHLASVITLTRLAIRQFLKQGGSGCIIHTCPLSGTCGYIFDPLFFAAKSAVRKKGKTGPCKSIETPNASTIDHWCHQKLC